MSKEIEIKVLEIDKKEVISKLRKVGAKKKLDARLKVRFFDFPDKRLTKKNNAVRLRKEGKKTKITIKDKFVQNKFKQVIEYETEVQDFEAITQIFNLIGLKIVAEQEKDRISYKYKDITFDIDTYPRIPTLLEIEAENLTKLKEGLRIIGKTIKDSNSKTGKELFAHYGIDVMKIRNLKF
jgi:adenylate cyclase class 2